MSNTLSNLLPCPASRVVKLCLMCLVISAWPGSAVPADRLTVSLNGAWEIADGVSADAIPETFTHTVPVPGLANLATPAFERVDAFYSREQLANRIRSKLSPKEWLTEFWNGKVDQDRNYFWYRKMFRAPEKRQVALLKINKAQFGTAVWLNGQKLGEYAGCFSASYFHLEDAIRWNAENTLVVRIGAHPAVLPDTYPTGFRFREDQVDARHLRQRLADLLRQSVDRDDPGRAAHRARRNHRADHGQELQRPGRQEFAARMPSERGRRVTRWRCRHRSRFRSAPGEEKVLTQTIAIPDAHLWSPEDPFLYVLRIQHGRRLGEHALRHARVSVRRRHQARLLERQGLLPARLEHHAAPVPRGSALQRPALERSVGAQAARRTAQEDALELLPVLHRPGAGSLAGDLRRSRPADSERVLRLDRSARAGTKAIRAPTTRRK